MLLGGPKRCTEALTLDDAFLGVEFDKIYQHSSSGLGKDSELTMAINVDGEEVDVFIRTSNTCEARERTVSASQVV